VLHHDGRWSHEGQPIRHRKLREKFDRSVRFLPDEGKYVVQIGRFRGEIEVEEAGFFVRDVDLASGNIVLSDGTREGLVVASLRRSPIDGAWLCSVKRDLLPEGVAARFLQSPQSELLAAVEERGRDLGVRVAGRFERLPDL